MGLAGMLAGMLCRRNNLLKFK